MQLLLGTALMLAANAVPTEPLTAVTTPMGSYQTMVDGEVAGSNTLWVRQLLNEAGLDANFVIYPWARAYQLARTEPNVLIYAMARLPERESQFHWIGPIANFELAVLVKTEQQAALKQQLLQGGRMSLAVPRDHAAVPLLKAMPEADQLDLFFTATTDEAFQLLVHKRVDAVVENPALLTELLEPYQLPGDTLQLLWLLPVSGAAAYLAASKTTDPHLVERLQQAWQRLYGVSQPMPRERPE